MTFCFELRDSGGSVGRAPVLTGGRVRTRHGELHYLQVVTENLFIDTYWFPSQPAHSQRQANVFRSSYLLILQKILHFVVVYLFNCKCVNDAKNGCCYTDALICYVVTIKIQIKRFIETLALGGFGGGGIERVI